MAIAVYAERSYGASSRERKCEKYPGMLVRRLRWEGCGAGSCPPAPGAWGDAAPSKMRTAGMGLCRARAFGRCRGRCSISAASRLTRRSMVSTALKDRMRILQGPGLTALHLGDLDPRLARAVLDLFRHHRRRLRRDLWVSMRVTSSVIACRVGSSSVVYVGAPGAAAASSPAASSLGFDDVERDSRLSRKSTGPGVRSLIARPIPCPSASNSRRLAKAAADASSCAALPRPACRRVRHRQRKLLRPKDRRAIARSQGGAQGSWAGSAAA